MSDTAWVGTPRDLDVRRPSRCVGSTPSGRRPAPAPSRATPRTPALGRRLRLLDAGAVAVANLVVWGLLGGGTAGGRRGSGSPSSRPSSPSSPSRPTASTGPAPARSARWSSSDWPVPPRSAGRPPSSSGGSPACPRSGRRSSPPASRSSRWPRSAAASSPGCAGRAPRAGTAGRSWSWAPRPRPSGSCGCCDATPSSDCARSVSSARTREHGTLDGVPWLGGIDTIVATLALVGANGVVIASGDLDAGDLNATVRTLLAAGVHVQLSNGLWGIDHHRLRPVPLAHEPFVYVEPASLRRGQQVCKRVLDVTVSASLLVLSRAGAPRRDARGPAAGRGARDLPPGPRRQGRPSRSRCSSCGRWCRTPSSSSSTSPR